MGLLDCVRIECTIDGPEQCADAFEILLLPQVSLFQ